MSGNQIIALWKELKEVVDKLPSYENHIGEILKRKGYTINNDLFYSCWCKKEEVVFHVVKYIGTWTLCEYIGLYGKATEIRYIKPTEEYEVQRL